MELTIPQMLGNGQTVGKKVFDQNNGVEFIEDIKEFSSVENFEYYYTRLKRGKLFKLSSETNKVESLWQHERAYAKAKELNDIETQAEEHKQIINFF